MKLYAFLLFSAIICINAELPKIRFEYKYSFKGPHLVQKDRSVPFWEYQGDAIASDDNIRITPSLRSKKGSVWTKSPATFDHFSIEIVFKVTGRGRVGADGLAVWFTEMKGLEGPVFGSNDYWKGLAVLFDSFDNDGQHNNPYIMAMVNDGTKQYEHQNDGINQQLGGCMRDFRNKPFPVRAKIEYYNKILTVFFNSGLTNNKDDFELCLRAENVELPKSGYFGISAATGGLADDHDALAFLTHSLVPPGQNVDSRIDDTEKAKYDKEFDQYYEELEKQKKEYQEQHPDKIGQGQFENLENAYENQADRELRMIFEGQNMIHQTLRELGKRSDELLGRQEMILTKVSQFGGGVAVPQQGGQQGGAVPAIDTIKRHEVDRVLNSMNEIIQEARQIRNIVNDVQQRANIIQGNLGQGGQVQQGGTGGGANPQMQLAMHEVQENVRTMKSDVSQLLHRPQGAGGCPLPPPCLSPTLFFIAIVIQVVILIGYMVYKYQEQHPDKVGQGQFENLENGYENQADRELRMIFEGQNMIHQTLRELGKRSDELLGRQEMILTKVSQFGGGVAVPQQGGQQGGAVPAIDTIKRHEVDRVLNSMNEIIQEARQIRNIVNDVQQRANIIQGNLGQGGQVQQGGTGGGANPQMQLAMHEVQENVRTMKSDVSQLLHRPQGAGGCPLPPPCLSPTLFFIAIVIQVVILIGYMVYKQNKENQAKKFF